MESHWNDEVIPGPTFLGKKLESQKGNWNQEHGPKLSGKEGSAFLGLDITGSNI